ncbi:Secoisolariciresinol dehydrogenase [Actinidia chinensis var. chinensis]|uniref:Secoisolariciresinol dehydrogenase n=1 Tax=Actinidia chinensis var. chinensis TaxID=1590841 RepID=A0A2R6R617_ACTCC|nr:Secoisolariciresinol dehydrogenase [Actinidia chinensis var. chinensis]
MMEGSSSLSPTPHRLAGKVAVITGGASGIGAATARLFVKHGAKVVIADVQDALGLSLCDSIRSFASDSVSFVHCDVTSDSDVGAAVDAAVAKHGRLDIMFSNAGTPGSPSFSILDLNRADLENVFNVNVFGAFNCAKHAARVMVPARKGTIIFTSSVVSVTAGLCQHPYTASKHAVVGLAKNLCVELGEFGIRVNCLSPYAVYTPMYAKNIGLSDRETGERLILESGNLKGVVLETEDVAAAAVWLASEESKYVSGLNLVLDGGYGTTNPGFVEAVKKIASL